MVGGEGEFHCHVLAILSSHPLQLLRVLDVHRLEEERRNVRFFFSHKISWKGGDSWKSLRKEVKTLEETCIICNFIFSTSTARACDILLYLSACLSLFENMHYRDPAGECEPMWRGLLIDSHCFSQVLESSSFPSFCSGRRCSLGQASNLPQLLQERSLLKT